jgi:hypothetical protein
MSYVVDMLLPATAFPFFRDDFFIVSLCCFKLSRRVDRGAVVTVEWGK